MANDTVYYGWIDAFSDATDHDELLLRDVTVLVSSSGEKLYEMPLMYISRARKDITLEYPFPSGDPSREPDR